MLTPGQARAEEIVEKGGNVFITGGGGVGKSYLVNRLKTKNSIIASPTGVSAQIIGGVTNHRTFNAPIGVIKPSDINKLTEVTKNLLKKVDKVFLDEISMNRYDMFCHIDKCLQVANENTLPFGGKQIVATGDLFQLCAFISPNEKTFYNSLYGTKLFPFEADNWNFETVELNQPMRNTNEEQIRILQKLREGVDSKDVVSYINNKARIYNPDEDFVHLCSYNKDVDARNTVKYHELKEDEVVYKGEVKGSLSEIMKDIRVPIKLPLKLNMRVMIVANDINETYVNGSTGTIVQMEEDAVYVRLDNGNVVLVTRFEFEVFKYVPGSKKISRKITSSLKQFPIIPGWASSIHKAQGCTIENAVLNLGDFTMAEAVVYVGVTRVKDIANLSLIRPLRVDDIKVNRKVKMFMQNLRHKGE